MGCQRCTCTPYFLREITKICLKFCLFPWLLSIVHPLILAGFYGPDFQIFSKICLKIQLGRDLWLEQVHDNQISFYTCFLSNILQIQPFTCKTGTLTKTPLNILKSRMRYDMQLDFKSCLGYVAGPIIQAARKTD